MNIEPIKIELYHEDIPFGIVQYDEALNLLGQVQHLDIVNLGRVILRVQHQEFIESEFTLKIWTHGVLVASRKMLILSHGGHAASENALVIENVMATITPSVSTDLTHRKGESSMNNEQIAELCHNVNKAYCESTGDLSQPTWKDAPDWQKSSAINGVAFHLSNDVTPEQSHENWLAQKLEEGWVYGKVKDSELKTHPCMMRYEELPKYQRTKDLLFTAVCNTFK
jgi:hypothetical protein